MRLKVMSKGMLVLNENGYGGDMQRHWLKNLSCEHVFKASLKEVWLIGSEKICPFCNEPGDLSRYGSIEAVQEHVYKLSHGNIEFMPDNVLGSSGDYYKFACNIHHFIFEMTFQRFLDTPNGACHLCDF